MSGNDPHGRPRPQYGEYATPEEQRAAIKQPAEWQLEATAGATHDATPVQAAPPAAQHPGEQQRRDEPPHPVDPGLHWPQEESRQPQAPARPRPSFGDRFLTYVLLGFGLYNVVDMIQNAISGGALMRESSSSLGASEAQMVQAMPNWLWTAIAISYVVVWLGTLVAALSAIRAGRRSFWIPVTGAVVAVVLVIALMAIAVGQNPDMLNNLPTPTGSNGIPS